ncbi:MAG: DUF115 domain-containing protein, partial [Planctomycetes bacterium]|nr:DUF115 domain-containing protein [Planctomycetota bacterium]
AVPRDDIVFVETDDDSEHGKVLSATIGEGDEVRSLASRRRPLAEAERFARGFDPVKKGAVAVLGFGVGHHVGAVARRLKKTGVVMCFEPDVGLLRAVLERIDHSTWIDRTTFVLLTDAQDAGMISTLLHGVEPIVVLGTEVMRHEPSRPRLGRAAGEFGEQLTRVIRAIRTNIMSTLVKVETTQRNFLQNVDHYTLAPGVAELEGCCQGRPAIVVSAGPSLRRNMHLLAGERVRERFVIIAAQTVLGPMLDAGIKPHFVTALDFHEISARFYEGLSAADVAGVTLVAEAKANPAILDAYPGRIRVPGDRYLRSLLGADFVADKGAITPGATVAHLAYYLGRYLGCDPVILIGQDLGFTDGQYYAAGAAIHRVWSSELNAFNTLEMMEWQRIVRGRRTLHRAEDTLGRPIYTDEQMLAYLTQFERDFLADTGRGLRVIDATEGGVVKRHTETMTLAGALDRFMPATPLALPETPPARPRSELSQVAERIRMVRRDVTRVSSHSADAKRLLKRMLASHADKSKVNELIRRVHVIKERVRRVDPAYSLVQQLNQTGALNRIRADREISLAEDMSPLELQKKQIERDVKNVSWLGDAADQLVTMLDDALASLDGAAKITRDKAVEEADSLGSDRSAPDVSISGRRVWAVIPVDVNVSGLGVRRKLVSCEIAGVNVLRLTLGRLARCETISNVAILTDEPETVRAIAGRVPDGLQVEFVRTPRGALGDRARAVGAARRWSSACWRGALGSLTCYDEVFDPKLFADAMERLDIDAAVVLGPDWAMIEPGLTDRVVRRHLESPEWHKIVFAHVAPGLAPCLIARSLVREMADEADGGGAFATIGGLLGYVPIRPLPDPIVKPLCVRTDPVLRDLGLRCIADTPDSRRLVQGVDLEPSGAIELAASIRDRAGDPAYPQQVTIELCTRRLTGGIRERWQDTRQRADAARAWMEPMLAELCAARPDAAVTLGGNGDPLLHDCWEEIVSIAQRAGAAVHVRTDLICDAATIERLLACGAGVVSVDLLADDAQTYRDIAGVDHFEQVRANVETLLGRRPSVGGLPLVWIVPRITRCDAVYEQIEPFFDRWIMRAGCAVIDPLPVVMAGERIEPLPLPREASRRLDACELFIRSDGRATVSQTPGSPAVGDVTRERLADVWRSVLEARRSSVVEPRSAVVERLAATV